jgi:hypothetical protein
VALPVAPFPPNSTGLEQQASLGAGASEVNKQQAQRRWRMQHSSFTAVNISGDCLPGPKTHSRAYAQVYCERTFFPFFHTSLAILLVWVLQACLHQRRWQLPSWLWQSQLRAMCSRTTVRTAAKTAQVS